MTVEEIDETAEVTVSEEDKKDDNRTQEKSQEAIEKQNKSIENKGENEYACIRRIKT